MLTKIFPNLIKRCGYKNKNIQGQLKDVVNKEIYPDQVDPETKLFLYITFWLVKNIFGRSDNTAVDF